MLDPVFFHFSFKAGLAPPVRVLTSIVGEHLFRNTVFGDAAAVGLQHVFGGLTAIQSQAGNVTAVVIHEADQVSIASRQPERHDVALPQLVGAGPFEESGLGWVPHRLALGLVDQTFLGQRFVYSRWAGGNQEKSFKDIGYPSWTRMSASMNWAPKFLACRRPGSSIVLLVALNRQSIFSTCALNRLLLCSFPSTNTDTFLRDAWIAA